MKKILVISSFPANYRVDVFKGLAYQYELTVLFGSVSDENRNAKWFIKNNEFPYYDVSSEKGKTKAKECFRDLRNYDLLLAYDWYQQWALKFELKAKLLGIPYVINCDGAFIRPFHLKDFIKKFFVKNASACLAGGFHAKEYFMHYGATPKKIYVHKFTSLHKADILERPLSVAEKKYLRRKLNLGEKKMVLSIGQFIPRKGFDILIDAWRTANISDAQLVIIGGGQLAKEYQRIIYENKIPNITIMDFVPFNQIFDYYKAANIFALATREDIWGLIVNEAMSCGIPVLVADRCIAGLELIKDGFNGVVIKNNTATEWAKSLLKFLSYSEEELMKMGNNAISTVSEYTIENTINDDINAIDNIIGVDTKK